MTTDLTLLSHYITGDKGDFEPLAAMTLPIRDRYCAKWGAKHIVHQGAYHDPGLYYAIQRLHLLLDLMKKPDATMWWWVLNIQAVITNHTKNVLDYTDDVHDFFLTRDVNGLNAGSFLVKNTPAGREWIEFVANEAPHHPEWQQWEQNVMKKHENDPRFKDHIKVVDHPAFNDYLYPEYKWPDTTPGNWFPGHFVLSLPGMNLQQKLAIVSSKEIRDAIIWE